jgi:hypothetical protein
MKLRVLVAAEREVAAAYAYYESQSEGLGRRMTGEIRGALAGILDFPEAHPIFPPAHRSGISKNSLMESSIESKETKLSLSRVFIFVQIRPDGGNFSKLGSGLSRNCRSSTHDATVYQDLWKYNGGKVVLQAPWTACSRFP